MFRMPKLLIMSLLFACIGITTEVVFTSVSKLVNRFIADDAVDWALEGKTYLWMFLIYAAIPILFRLFYDYMKHYSILVRALIAVLAIYIIEFSAGFILEITTGVCPWKYDTGLHVLGYIRLDYFPFWYVFALLIISVYGILWRRIE